MCQRRAFRFRYLRPRDADLHQGAPGAARRGDRLRAETGPALWTNSRIRERAARRWPNPIAPTGFPWSFRAPGIFGEPVREIKVPEDSELMDFVALHLMLTLAVVLPVVL